MAKTKSAEVPQVPVGPRAQVHVTLRCATCPASVVITDLRLKDAGGVYNCPKCNIPMNQVGEPVPIHYSEE